ncbi:MAG TPA: hypothetical protein VL442_04880 [Mucilaginibacter sp.]|jgi:hypothetical protein|nr:hypothetical protein [Mucilaginibacter sp.]
MKKIILSLAIALLSYCSYAQSFNPTSNINSPGTANSFLGGYTFAYATSGSPWNGAFMSFGGFPPNNYDCQISTDYGPHGGNHISFRTRNGDAATWNNWYEIWHSGNLNNSSSDFIARSLNAEGLHIKSNAYSSSQGLYLGWNKSGYLGEANLVSNIGGGTGGFTFDNTIDGTSFTRLVTITGNGNMLIGQSTQANSAYKLDVYGKARANEIVVNTSGADFVFGKQYALPKLSDVKTYIDKNQHLPEIPSAKEMQTNGMSVGEINTKLLQKVEELTLYLIEKDKQDKEKDVKFAQQQKQIDELKEQLKSVKKG